MTKTVKKFADLVGPRVVPYGGGERQNTLNEKTGTDVDIKKIAERLRELAKNEIMAIGPLLALIEEMVEDAGRQYDATSATVLKHIVLKLVGKLEEARDQDRWVSVKRAAAVVRRPEGTVRYWCRNNLVEARKVGARDWEIDRDSLLRRGTV